MKTIKKFIPKKTEKKLVGSGSNLNQRIFIKKKKRQMGLLDTFRDAAETIVEAFDDIPKSVTYVQKGASVYVPGTGAVTSTDTEYTTTAIFDEYEMDEVNNSVIRATDKLAYIASNDLEVTPVVDDEIVDADSVTWQIINVGSDPADALWMLQIRKP